MLYYAINRDESVERIAHPERFLKEDNYEVYGKTCFGKRLNRSDQNEG